MAWDTADGPAQNKNMNGGDRRFRPCGERGLVMQQIFRVFGRLTLALPLVVLATGQPAGAQPAPDCSHGVTIQKTCDTPVRTCASNEDCPGDSMCAEGVCNLEISDHTHCTISVRNADECEDDIQVNAGFDTLEFPSGNQRVPAVGNLPILDVTGNAVCAAGPALPCIIGTPGSTANSLPGDATAGRVRFTSQYTLTAANQLDLVGETDLPDQATVTVQDLCNGPNGTAGCNVTPNNVQFTASTPVVEGCEVNNFDVSTTCELDANKCTPDHCDGNGACVSNGPPVSCPGPVPPCEGGQECNPATGSCQDLPDAAVSTDCELDDNLCTIDHCDGNGSCVTESDVQCNDAQCEVCIPDTGMCQVDETDPRCQSELICRTPGFWGTHGGVEKSRSQNITQAVIDMAGGSLSICGTTITSSPAVGDGNSALEAICVSPRGDQTLQLARQLTSLALNCTISNVGGDCAGHAGLSDLFEDCNKACVGDPTATRSVGDCIGEIDCFNNGGCEFNAVSNCHEQDLPEGFQPPGPAGSSNDCRDARGNDCTVIGPGAVNCN
jgi:hypothetical protein